MSHSAISWIEAPLVMLGIRSAVKGDLQASPTELVYGEPLLLPGETHRALDVQTNKQQGRFRPPPWTANSRTKANTSHSSPSAPLFCFQRTEYMLPRLPSRRHRTKRAPTTIHWTSPGHQTI